MDDRPIRILHVVGSLNRGGIETWLLHVLRFIDRDRFRFDFVVHTMPPGALLDDVLALGANVYPCLEPSHPFGYERQLRCILRDHGPYDVVHSHVHHYSGNVVRIAQRAGVPVRIVHSHSDTSRVQRAANRPRRVYHRVMKTWIHRHATIGLSGGELSGQALFGSRWGVDARYCNLYYGIDLAPFRSPVDREAVRHELGIPEDAFVVGHVGSFRTPKNHSFLVDVAAELVRLDPRLCLLLIGDGPLRPAIEAQVATAGLGQSVRFLGVRPDVPRLLRGALDAFVLPSLYEGLPMVGLEAQAAGLPCVIADVITREVDVAPESIHRLSLDQSARVWAETLVGCRETDIAAQSRATVAKIAGGPFDICRGVRTLEQIYAAKWAPIQITGDEPASI